MSNTDLYYAELTDLSVRIAVGLNNRRDPLDELTQALDQLSQTNSIKGKAADAMKAYISEVHMTLIQTLQLILFNYQAALGKYVTGYLGVDSDENFKLIEEDFAAHEHNLSSHRSDFTSIGKKLKAISDEAEDIVSLSGAGSKRLFNVADEMKTMKKTVSDLKEKWDKYEKTDPGFGDVENLIVQTTSLLKNTLSVPRGYSYSPGSFSNLMSKNFVDAFEVNANYAQKPDTQKAFKANWDRICKNYKVDQKRMAEEKAKEETEKEGRRALIWDELQIAAGAALVVTGAGTGFGVLLIAGGVNGYINHTSMALTGNSFNIMGSLTNEAAQWYNKNIGEPLVKTGNPIAKFAAGLGNSAIQTAGGMGQFNVYDIGKAGYTLCTNHEARAQFKTGLKNYWNKLRSGDAYTIGQTVGIVASVLVNPGDISAAAGKASKAESLLGKVGIFSKSIAISSAENAKNIVTSPLRMINNIRNKAADLRTLFSDGKGVVGDFTKSVVVSDAENANSVLTKVKGKLRDVGTASGAFAKAFGKTYVVESRKYANTCFCASSALGASIKTFGKSTVAGLKEAKSALNFDKGVSNPIRETVLNNIAESQAARNASRFGLSGTTSEMIPLSQKNVIKLLEQRGLNPEMAKSFNKSFDGTIYARRGVSGENFIATENSFKDASAVFVTKGSAGATPIDRINKLALPPSNKALIESQVKLAKDQILLEGKVAPQPEWATQAGDGIPRIGGGWQIVTNGGKWNGAVEWIVK